VSPRKRLGQFRENKLGGRTEQAQLLFEHLLRNPKKSGTCACKLMCRAHCAQIHCTTKKKGAGEAAPIKSLHAFVHTLHKPLIFRGFENRAVMQQAAHTS